MFSSFFFLLEIICVSINELILNDNIFSEKNTYIIVTKNMNVFGHIALKSTYKELKFMFSDNLFMILDSVPSCVNYCLSL